ncbi:MAG: hypothetical protein LAT66_15305 [Alkalimonas sp.]|nr:hypothetical protein [Alkalimonas sp.]
MLPQLSRRAWNNVLIFAVLILMFLLYGMPQRLADLPHRSTSLLDEHTLLGVEYPLVRLSRSTQGWRLSPSSPELQPLAEQTMSVWQQQQLHDGQRSVAPTPEPLTQATLMLAGQAEPVIWVLLLADEQFWLSPSHRTMYYPISAQDAERLFPMEFR